MAVARRRSLVDELFDDFAGQIRSGRLVPGERLPTEKVLSAELAVSRTVVREAVARLTAHGLTVPKQGSGVFVAEGPRYEAFQVTPEELSALEDVMKLLEMRVAIEAEMAALAAERRSPADVEALHDHLMAMSPEAPAVDETVDADVAFHRSLARATGNQYFERFIDFLGVRLVPPRTVYLAGRDETAHRDYLRGIWKEHEAIYKAVEKGDPKAAAAAARLHMTRSLKRHAERLGR
jgi:GntR family transcriptional regulator, transcriptional repressor for pyruvate dehydrogenase complex